MTDQDLLTELQYAAVEAVPNAGASWPSGLWTVDEISGYMNQRQRKLLYETGCVCTRASLPTTPNVLRYDYPTNWIQTRRATWFDGVVFHPLLRSEAHYLDLGLPSWGATLSPFPVVYLDDILPTVQILVAPGASAGGVLQILYVSIGTSLSNTGVPFVVKDDFVPIIKWGVLADMFGKVCRAHDQVRAQYAESRFTLGIEAIKSLLWADPVNAP